MNQATFDDLCLRLLTVLAELAKEERDFRAQVLVWVMGGYVDMWEEERVRNRGIATGQVIQFDPLIFGDKKGDDHD